MILYWTYPSIEWMVGILKYLFIGPDEKHFDVKKANKVKKLVQSIFDYDFEVEKSERVDIILKPSAGFTATVAESIVEYRKKNSESRFHVSMVSEFRSDFDNLTEEVQALFKGLCSGSVYSMVYDTDGKRYGSSTAYSNVVNKGNCIVFYYEEGSKVDKAFEKEYSHILKNCKEKINLADNFKGEDYKSSGVRKKAASLTYAYRINLTLPNGEKFTEEKAGFVVPTHAYYARTKRLVDAMWQDVNPNDITLTKLFEEFIKTKTDTPALQEKYKQYYKTWILDEKLGDVKLHHFWEADTIFRSLPIILRGRFIELSLEHRTDARYSEELQYEKSLECDGCDIENHYLSDKYKQGFYAMLSNLFDYAYQKKYIPYQPLLLIDLSER